MQDPKPSKVVAIGAAIKLWKLYRFGSPRELVLEDLALALGVLVTEGRLDAADARLVRSGTRGLIRVKEDIPERGRKRFAVAHELGHWLLHKDITQINACTDQNMAAKYKASAPEVEANYFAAELLLPESVFAPRIRRVRPSFQLVKALAGDFDTSLTATAIRLAEVSDDYCAVVVSEGEKVRWWRGSPKFEERFWIEAGARLSPETIAGALFQGEVAPHRPVEVEAEAWVEIKDEEDDECEIFIEEAIVLEPYGQVLSILSLP